MAKQEGGAIKYDPNTEVFQARAEMVKQENCRKQWYDRWSWLLDEQDIALAETNAIRSQLPKLPGHGERTGEPLARQKYPPTSTGMIGWLSTKPECKLEIFTPWMLRVPIRQPDAWNRKDYYGVCKED